METIKLIISDETLRDGEQQVGIFFAPPIKHHLATLIAQTGVHQIATMPAICDSEAALIKTLVQQNFGHQIAASTMMERQFIDQAKHCGVQQLILFHAVSDRLLFLRDPELRSHPRYSHQGINADVPPQVIHFMRQRMIDNVLDHLQYAHAQGLKLCFAAEDASRAEFDFLVHCIQTFQPYLSHFLLCDTVGVLTPEKTYVWLRDLLEYTNHALLVVHFHNDMGMALENSIQAVLAGASGVSGTFNGIGERAGNVALEQVLQGLRMRFGWEVDGINYDAVEAVTAFLNQLGARSHPPYSRLTQRHESGIHVNSLLRDRQSYCHFPYAEPEIWFGKYSGASNFQYLFEHHLGRSLSREQYEYLRSAIKTLSIQQQRSFSTDEILEFLDKGILNVY